MPLQKVFFNCLRNSLSCIKVTEGFSTARASANIKPCPVTSAPTNLRLINQNSDTFSMKYKQALMKCIVVKSRDQRYFHSVYPVFSAPQGIAWEIPANLKWILDSRAQLWTIIPCVSLWTVFNLLMFLCPTCSRCKDWSCERQWSRLNDFHIYRSSVKFLNKGVGIHPQEKLVPRVGEWGISGGLLGEGSAS